MAAFLGQGARLPFAALLGVHGPDGLAYAGKVGTGFGGVALQDLRSRFVGIEAEKPAADVPRAEARGAHWLEAGAGRRDRVQRNSLPTMSCAMPAFWACARTSRRREVVVEEPVPLSGPPGSASRDQRRPRPCDLSRRRPDQGRRADYYRAAAPILLPWLADRPISLVRCPQGRARACFFQKHDAGSFGEHVHHVDVREKDGSVEPYLYVDDADGILACVQMGTIEFHGWGSSGRRHREARPAGVRSRSRRRARLGRCRRRRRPI